MSCLLFSANDLYKKFVTFAQAPSRRIKRNEDTTQDESWLDRLDLFPADKRIILPRIKRGNAFRVAYLQCQQNASVSAYFT